MTAIIIDGKKVSEAIKNEVKAQTMLSNFKPCLAVVIVGKDPASMVYVGNKKKACEYTGINSISYELDEQTTEDELLALVDKLNANDNVHGILIQLPLPKHIDANKILLRINPNKDVDGFHPYNVGMLNIGKPLLKPCTPWGIVELIKRSNIQIQGKSCVVVGRSNIVGKPVASLLLSENATVTVCHSKTSNLPKVCSSADILVAALGKPKFITADMVKSGAVVIDVGIHRQENGKLCGDVAFDEVSQKAAYITPVPGGVGPMTIAMLMQNCLSAAKELTI